MASDENYSQDEEEITFITNDLLDYSVAKRTFMVDSKEATQVGKTWGLGRKMKILMMSLTYNRVESMLIILIFYSAGSSY